MKNIVIMLAAVAVLVLAGCGGSSFTRDGMVKVCDPECSWRPKDQVNQDLRHIEEDDGRMAALEAEAEKNPLAAYDLSLRFFRGDGVPRNTFKAVTWMRRAADKGNMQAQKALGSLYLTGLGEMGADPGEAQIWLSLAAAQGDQESKQLLAQAEALNQARKDDYRAFERQKEMIRQMWQTGYSYNMAWDGRSRSWNYGGGHGRRY